MAGLSFEILIDDALAGITSASQLTTLVNKRVLGLINDFEDAEWRYPKFQNTSRLATIVIAVAQRPKRRTPYQSSALSP